MGTRLEKLETDFQAVRSSIEALTQAVQLSLPKQSTRPAPSSGFVTGEDGADASGAPPGLSRPQPKAKASAANQAAQLASRLSLDPTVVASALQSGVSLDQLETIGHLVREKPQRLEDLPRRSKGQANPLSESENEENQDGQVPELPGNLDPVTAALTQLTKIVTKLTDGKKKEPSLEDALDGVGSASSTGQDGGVTFSSRRNAAALKALKKALIQSPKQIWKSVEQHMEEDFHLRAAAPGLGQQQMTARGWLQYRSRVQNYPQSVRWSWAAAGALDALRSGAIDEARARLCLMLCQAEQQSIDRGSWLLCQEIALEPAPPYSTFAGHSLPDQTEQQFSRLLDPRWVDAFVAAVKENDDYVERRKKLGTRSGRQGEEDQTEILRAKRRDLVLPSDLFLEDGICFVQISKPKSGLRGLGSIQHAKITDPRVIELCEFIFRLDDGDDPLYGATSSTYRRRWDAILKSLGVPISLQFTPASLRGGGAVHKYRAGATVTDVMWALRLKHVETLQHYLQEVTASLSLASLPETCKQKVRASLALFPVSLNILLQSRDHR
eukprot:Skav202341  [mRNA]  locus=scaffold2638:25078:31004:- [translate_table: standard]